MEKGGICLFTFSNNGRWQMSRRTIAKRFNRLLSCVMKVFISSSDSLLDARYTTLYGSLPFHTGLKEETARKNSIFSPSSILFRLHTQCGLSNSESQPVNSDLAGACYTDRAYGQAGKYTR